MFKTLLYLFLSFTLCSPVLAAPPDSEILSFPEGFLWGSATAAYQVEGGIQNDWSAAGVDAGESVNHWQRYEEDFDALERMGHHMYRMSLSWARIEPQPGQFNEAALAQYQRMLRSLSQRGIVPMVTLFHFTAPQWFSKNGGWQKAENISHYLRFVNKVSAYFADDVYYWNTLNEPMVFAFRSYDEGEWPPFVKDRNVALTVARNLIVAHGKAYRIIHKHDAFAKVGFAKHISILDPHWPINPVDQIITRVQSDLFNHVFWQSIIKGELHLDVPGLEPQHIAFDPELKHSADFLGVNYYSRYKVRSSGKLLTPPDAPRTELNWAIAPDGMARALRMANTYAQQLHVPIIITENGLADADDDVRPGFLVHHLKAVHDAILAGVPVMGYLHWSLIDNFEWTDGYGPKFGLMNAQRQWRPSAKLYQQIIAKNALPAQWLNTYPLRGEALSEREL